MTGQEHGLYEADPMGILAVVSQSYRRYSMDSTSQPSRWTPYEVKAASILYERRTEDLQLEQLWIRLQKKMREAESQASEPTAA
jgi:hypothetical protein